MQCGAMRCDHAAPARVYRYAVQPRIASVIACSYMAYAYLVFVCAMFCCSNIYITWYII